MFRVEERIGAGADRDLAGAEWLSFADTTQANLDLGPLAQVSGFAPLRDEVEVARVQLGEAMRRRQRRRPTCANVAS